MSIGYQVRSGEDSPQTIVVCPGSPGSHRARFPCEALAGLDARIVMTERPGFGVTPRQPGRTVGDHVPQLLAVADELGADRFAVVGWSAGGSYALACGAMAPERVAAVVLMSAHVSTFDRAEADHAVSSHHQMIVKGLRDDPEGTAQAIASFMRPQAEAYAADPGGFKVKWMADAEVAWGRRPADYWLDVLDDVIGQPPENLADEYVAINGPLGFTLGDVRVPVRAFHGSSDTNVPIEGARDLISRMPDATLVEWEGENHFASPTCIRAALEAAILYL